MARQRSFSCPDISEDSSLELKQNLSAIETKSEKSKTVGKLDSRIFSDVIRKQCDDTDSEDVIGWTFAYLEQLFVLLAHENKASIMVQKPKLSTLLATISEESTNSVTVLENDQPQYSKVDIEMHKELTGKETGSRKETSKMPNVESESLEKTNLENKNNIVKSDKHEKGDKNYSEEKDTRSKIENIILNMYETFTDSIPEEILQESMGKVHPLFKKLKDVMILELSNYTRLNNNCSKVSTTPAISGPPPPAPPPPPPPKEIVLNIKVKTMGRTLSEAESNVADGSAEDIERRINKKPKKDDMMSQLQMKLQARQRRESLKLRMSQLK